MSSRKIWEKTDYSSTLSRTRKLIDDMAPDVDPVALRKAREGKGLVTAGTAAISRERRRDTESLDEFIAKKREMFLVQVCVCHYLRMRCCYVYPRARERMRRESPRLHLLTRCAGLSIKFDLCSEANACPTTTTHARPRVQMSLDIKREEIKKLEALAAAKEEALQKSEAQIEDDAARRGAGQAQE